MHKNWYKSSTNATANNKISGKNIKNIKKKVNRNINCYILFYIYQSAIAYTSQRINKQNN